MFTCNCFIRKSTEELVDEVYRLRDRSGEWFWYSEIRTLLISEKNRFRCLDDERGNAEKLIKEGYIDCRNNEKMFLTLSALRDDSDKNQWFVNNKNGEYVFCKNDKFKYYILTDPTNLNSAIDISNNFHKATPTEIMEYFKLNY